jgi:hypothetical protein
VDIVKIDADVERIDEIAPATDKRSESTTAGFIFTLNLPTRVRGLGQYKTTS